MNEKYPKTMGDRSGLRLMSNLELIALAQEKDASELAVVLAERLKRMRTQLPYD